MAGRNRELVPDNKHGKRKSISDLVTDCSDDFQVPP